VAKKLDEVMKVLTAARRKKIEQRTMELATLKDLRKVAEQTQTDMAASLGLGQDMISRLQKQ
jgi:DNA-binding XRE family transcriptional regulator